MLISLISYFYCMLFSMRTKNEMNKLFKQLYCKDDVIHTKKFSGIVLQWDISKFSFMNGNIQN